MAYSRPLGHVEGNTMCACDVCGMPYRFPDELVYADDKRFYCKRTCWLGETVDGHFRRVAQLKPRQDDPRPPVMGRTPDYWE